MWGGGRRRGEGSLNPACTSLVKPDDQCEIMAVQREVRVSFHPGEALYILAGSPQWGETGRSSAYKYILSQRLMARAESRKAEVNVRWWGRCEEKLLLETVLVSGGAYTPVPLSWLPKEHGSKNNPVRNCSMLLSVLHDPSLRALPGLPRPPSLRQRSCHRVSEQLCFSFITLTLHFAITCVGDVIGLCLPSSL